MGLIKEPKNVDLIIKSEPWTENELKDFRKLMKELKTNRKLKSTIRSKKHYIQQLQ